MCWFAEICAQIKGRFSMEIWPRQITSYMGSYLFSRRCIDGKVCVFGLFNGHEFYIYLHVSDFSFLLSFKRTNIRMYMKYPSFNQAKAFSRISRRNARSGGGEGGIEGCLVM